MSAKWDFIFGSLEQDWSRASGLSNGWIGKPIRDTLNKLAIN